MDSTHELKVGYGLQPFCDLSSTETFSHTFMGSGSGGARRRDIESEVYTSENGVSERGRDTFRAFFPSFLRPTSGKDFAAKFAVFGSVTIIHPSIDPLNRRGEKDFWLAVPFLRLMWHLMVEFKISSCLTLSYTFLMQSVTHRTIYEKFDLFVSRIP